MCGESRADKGHYYSKKKKYIKLFASDRLHKVTRTKPGTHQTAPYTPLNCSSFKTKRSSSRGITEAGVKLFSQNDASKKHTHTKKTTPIFFTGNAEEADEPAKRRRLSGMR